MKRLFSLLLSAVMVASLAATASAWEENVDYVKLGDITAAAYPASTATGLPEVTTGQLLKGTIFTSQNAQGVQCDGANSAELMFDAKQDTHYKGLNLGWAGLILDQAYELTEVRVAPNPNLEAGDMFNFWLQGSNDGENWINIIIMRQDAHGNDYHIFTPATVTDQRYIDAGYSARKDESIHWVGKGGSYSMYRVVSGSVGELELYGNPAPATELSPEIASAMNISTPNYFPLNIHVKTEASVTTQEGSLSGTVIGSSGLWNKAGWDKAFDNNGRTHYDPSLDGPECWVGLLMDQPYALTEVRIMPKRGAYVDMQHARFQGSIDGVNWADLATFSLEDVPSKQVWVSKSITDTRGFTYFRYVSSADIQSSVADILIFGAPAEAAEPFTVDPLIATHNYFSGDIYVYPEKNVISDTEISGYPICGDYYFPWRSYDRGVEKAFDGDLSTFYGTMVRLNGPHYWVGLKADAPTVATSVKIYHDTIEDTYYFQGSVDGHTWVDLTTFNTTVDNKDADGWLTKTITDTTAYSYFRLFNSDNNHPSCDLGVFEMKIYGTAASAEAPETTAPETTAPETTAPETTAPETTAPETTAPETTAPETTAPETDIDTPAAPQTFDAGVIAAVAAVVSAAGYAIAKKRK